MIETKREKGTLTVYLSGEIDHCASATLRREIEAQLADPSITHLTLDFSKVTFMDSSGVGMVIGRYKTMHARGAGVSASGLHPPVDKLFYMAGLHRILTVEPMGRQDAHE